MSLEEQEASNRLLTTYFIHLLTASGLDHLPAYLIIYTPPNF